MYVVQQNGILGTYYNWTNNGSFTANAGTVLFNGVTQTLGGSSLPVFNNITVSSGSTTTINTTGEKIAGILLSNGTLNANGNLTLISTSSQTALIDGTGTGSILGSVTMQRYLTSSLGYKLFSSPFKYSTVNEFSNEINLSAAFPPVYKYDESLPSNGWYFYTATNDTLFPLKGYAVNFGDSTTPSTVDISGIVNNGTITSPTLYNTNQTYTQGFNLIGNPYPSPIDWNNASGWSKTNIDNAIYYFNASTDKYSGSYSSYIAGVSSDGIASNIIPAMQGFFIHVSNGSYPVSATLSINNNARLNTYLNPVFHKNAGFPDPLCRINIRFVNENELSDNLVIYFNDRASPGFDKEYDALKFENTNPNVPNLYALSPEGQSLSINALPSLSDSVTIIPIGIKIANKSWLVLHLQDILNMPTGIHVYIIDNKNGTFQDLTNNATYRMNVDAGTNANRYSIVFSKTDISNSTLLSRQLNAYFSKGKIFVNLDLITGNNGTLGVFNMLGQQLAESKLEGFGYHEINAPFSNGIYMINFYANGNVYSKKISINNTTN